MKTFFNILAVLIFVLFAYISLNPQKAIDDIEKYALYLGIKMDKINISNTVSEKTLKDTVSENVIYRKLFSNRLPWNVMQESKTDDLYNITCTVINIAQENKLIVNTNEREYQLTMTCNDLITIYGNISRSIIISNDDYELFKGIERYQKVSFIVILNYISGQDRDFAVVWQALKRL